MGAALNGEADVFSWLHHSKKKKKKRSLPVSDPIPTQEPYPVKILLDDGPRPGAYTIKTNPFVVTRWQYFSLAWTGRKRWSISGRDLWFLSPILIGAIVAGFQDKGSPTLLGLISFPFVVIWLGIEWLNWAHGPLFVPQTWDINGYAMVRHIPKKPDVELKLKDVNVARYSEKGLLIFPRKELWMIAIPYSAFKRNQDIRLLLSWLEIAGAKIREENDLRRP